MKPPHACADSITNIFRSASAHSSVCQPHPHTCMQHFHLHIHPSFLTQSAQRITRLPAAFNRKSPQGCGSWRQPLVSASSLVCRHTHAKALFTAEPDGNKEEEGRETESNTETDVPSGESNTIQRSKRFAEWKTPSRRVNNNNTGG